MERQNYVHKVSQREEQVRLKHLIQWPVITRISPLTTIHYIYAQSHKIELYCSYTSETGLQLLDLCVESRDQGFFHGN